jgi:hypothetical protein
MLRNSIGFLILLDYIFASSTIVKTETATGAEIRLHYMFRSAF